MHSSADAQTPPEDWLDSLTADTNGQALRLVRERLAEMRADVRRAMDAGSAPGDYAVQEKLLAAVDAAEQGTTAFWEKHNKR